MCSATCFWIWTMADCFFNFIQLRRDQVMAKVSKRVYGWKPDIPDQRDIQYAAVYKIPKKLPPKADLRPLCPAVEDQGNLGAAPPMR